MTVRLSASSAGHPLQPGRFLVLISIRGCVDPMATVQLEELVQLKSPMTSSAIETATFRLVAQCLNLLHYCVTPVHWSRRNIPGDKWWLACKAETSPPSMIRFSRKRRNPHGLLQGCLPFSSLKSGLCISRNSNCSSQRSDFWSLPRL
jgi:hypothetical protein